MAWAWGVPIGIDLAHYNMTGAGGAEPLGRFSTASPAGALTALWTRDDADISVGLDVQILFALIPMCLWLITSRPGRSAR